MALGFGAASGTGDPIRGDRGRCTIGTMKVGATATNVRTARLVKRSAADKVQVAGADDLAVLGLIGGRVRKESDKSMRFDIDRTNDFVTDDLVEVISPYPGCTLELRVASGETLVPGDLVIIAAAGEVKKAARTQVASGATAVTSSAANGDILTGSLGPDGHPLAKCLEEVDASGAAKWGLFEWRG